MLLLTFACRQTLDIETNLTPLVGDQSVPNCGFTLIPPPIDVCRDGAAIAGPERYERQTGQPVTHELSFSSPEGPVACIHITNGETDGSGRVSSARLWLDGNEVIGPNHFNQNVASVDKPLSIVSGNHLLETRVASMPGSSLTVEVRHAPNLNSAPGTGGRIRVLDLAANPPTFSPRSTQDRTALQFVLGFLPPTPSGSGFVINARFEIASADTCSPTTTLTTVTQLSEPADVQISAEWDGTEGGTNVADGVYFFRAVVDVFVIPAGGGAPSLLDTATTDVQRLYVDAGETVDMLGGRRLASDVFQPDLPTGPAPATELLDRLAEKDPARVAVVRATVSGLQGGAEPPHGRIFTEVTLTGQQLICGVQTPTAGRCAGGQFGGKTEEVEGQADLTIGDERVFVFTQVDGAYWLLQATNDLLTIDGSVFRTSTGTPITLSELQGACP